METGKDNLMETGKNVQAETGAAFVVDQIGRTLTFWARVTEIYSSYKLTQLRQLFLKARGVPAETLKEQLWIPQHQRAGQKMYSLCVDLRGFYLKAGQFIGARTDMIPEQICKELMRLHDQVPPMPPGQTREVLQAELGAAPIDAVFEWIDLDTPLGSASISQVHKAKLRGNGARGDNRKSLNGLSLQEVLKPAGSEVVDVEALPAVQAARRAASSKTPANGIVAVKIQYPDAEATMQQDMGNLRAVCAFLSKTEIKFDLVSVADELTAQLKLEFDFKREARVMDAIAKHLMASCKHVTVPRSIDGLVTDKMLVMDYVEGTNILRLADKISELSAAKRRAAVRRILSNVSEAYGRMLLLDGLFQADGHPGNILVQAGGRIGLLDYGQSKRLPDALRVKFASLILALDRGDEEEISAELWNMGVVTTKDEAKLRTTMAYNMFDTQGVIDAWSPDSPLKQTAITTFPKDLFFVLRVCQLLRALGNAMGDYEFSSVKQWKPFAQRALQDVKKGRIPLSANIML